MIAMGLARLGDASGASLLREMLQRSYWEQDGLVEVTADDGTPLVGPDGNAVRRDLTEVQVSGYLVAAVEAASPLGLPELDEAIGKLKTDPSSDVRAAAKAASERAGGVEAEPVAAGDETKAGLR
jgi:hypothetical protein